MKALRKHFTKHDVDILQLFNVLRVPQEGERTKQDDKIIEYVLANEVDKLRTAVEKKKFSAIFSADEKGRIA
jgi:hypothetical protein